MTKFTTALAALATLSTLAPAALADTFSRESTVEVKIADLDLTTSTGAQRLLTRIQDAAKEACHDPDSAVRNMERKCRDSIVEYNVARLNINTLAIAYNDAYGKTTLNR
jgi:UrcA family protein